MKQRTINCSFTKYKQILKSILETVVIKNLNTKRYKRYH